MKEELYKKIGKRYIMINDPWSYEGLREGHWHVWVRPGSVTIREHIWPARGEVAAAIEEVREAMVKALLEANKFSTPTPLTEKEKKAIKAYQKIMGEDFILTFTGISMADLVDAGIKVLKPNVLPNGEKR